MESTLTMEAEMTGPRTHLIIPDCQVKPGVPTEHIGWVGQLIVDLRRTITDIICLGDFADMESLSAYDRGKRQFEGRRYVNDIAAANEAFDLLCYPLEQHNAKMRFQHEPLFKPTLQLLLGNHEHRITRAVDDDAKLEGVIGIDDLNYAAHGFTVHDFLAPVTIDGLVYSHYFYNHNNGRSLSGNIENRLKTVGHSFVQGHQQGIAWGQRMVLGRPQMGLVAGSFYQHSETYRGLQADEWRGVVIIHNVKDGFGDVELVSMDRLCRMYEGASYSQFAQRRENQ